MEGDSIEACNWILQHDKEPTGLIVDDVITLRKLLVDHPHWSLKWVPGSQNQMAKWATIHPAHGELQATDIPPEIISCDYFDPP